MMMLEPVEKIIPKMAVPSIISFIITSIYNLADTFFVASLGTNASAAVSVNASLDQIIAMAGTMLAIGANSYVARLLGAKKEQKANEVLASAFFLALIFGTVVLIVGNIFMVPMVRLLGATATCEQYSIDYATYVLLAAPFMAANFVLNQCLRAEGSATLSMIGMSAGGILNCFLDPLFIFVFDMGVAGASLATAISKTVSFLILVFPYVTGRSVLRISPRNFKPTLQILREIVTVGSSALLRNSLNVASAIILNNIAGGISDSVLAGIGVTNKVMMFPFGIILGFGAGFQPVAGFNWGAKRYDRVRDAYKFAVKCALLISCAMGLFLGVFANQAIALFSETDAAMLEIGALCIRLQCLALPAHAWVAVVNMLCAGLGKGLFALLLSTSRQGSCFLPIVHLMARIGGAYGMAATQAVADLLSLVLAAPINRRMIRYVNETEREYQLEQATVKGMETL